MRRKLTSNAGRVIRSFWRSIAGICWGFVYTESRRTAHHLYPVDIVSTFSPALLGAFGGHNAHPLPIQDIGDSVFTIKTIRVLEIRVAFVIRKTLADTGRPYRTRILNEGNSPRLCAA